VIERRYAHVARSDAHKSQRTDRPRAAQHWANTERSLRIAGPISPHRCAQRATPAAAMRTTTVTDRRAQTCQRWAKVGQGARHTPHRCAHVGHTSPSDAHKAHRPTDRPTSDRRAYRPQLCAALRQIPAPAAQRCATFGDRCAATQRRTAGSHSQSDAPYRPTHKMYELASLGHTPRACGIGTWKKMRRRKPPWEPSQA
jgi:hypothetical protein